MPNDWSGSFGPKEGGPPAGARTPDTESRGKGGYMVHSSQGMSYAKEATEKYDHKGGMAGGVHESFPDIGDGLTEKHGTPSEMHEEGVHRFISMTPYPNEMSSQR